MIITTFLSVVLGLASPAEGAPGDGDSWIKLVPAKDLSSWRRPWGDWLLADEVQLDPQNPRQLAWKSGSRAAVNGPRGSTVNLVSVKEFADIEAQIEFTLSSRSNSGVYFMGRYEIQIYDSHGVVKDKYPGIECGGIYPRWVGREIEGHSPRVNASLPPGKWQRFDVIFKAPRFDAEGKKIRNAKFVKVVHNGQMIHENIEVTGPTRGALFEDEKPAGPLMLQGDHGPIAYRSVRIRPMPSAR